MDASEHRQQLDELAARVDELSTEGAKRHGGLYDTSVAALDGMSATQIAIIANAALFILARDADEGMLPTREPWKELMVSIAWAISTIDPLVNGEIAEAIPAPVRLRLLKPDADAETLRAGS
jgi:hypothetical protein